MPRPVLPLSRAVTAGDRGVPLISATAIHDFVHLMSQLYVADYATTRRYAHLAPDALGKIIKPFSRRTDAPVTHETQEGRSS
jgi:hypothetical protein